MSRFTAIVAVSAISAALAPAASATPETYTMDTYHTYPHFEVDHLGFSKMRGRFDKTTGKFTLDSVAKTVTFEFITQSASLSTGDNDKGNRPRARDEHLRSADFFNVAEFPTIAFKGNKAAFSGEAPSMIEGSLTMLGVTRPLALKVDAWKCGQHPSRKVPMCGGNASGRLKRTDFGMKYGVPNVGDELVLWIEFEAYKD